MGDPSKELSGEFSLMLNKSLALGAKNYPVTRAPRQPCPLGFVEEPNLQAILADAEQEPGGGRQELLRDARHAQMHLLSAVPSRI